MSVNAAQWMLENADDADTALVYKGSHTPYASLRQQVNELAKLIKVHTKPGDRVLLIADNQPFAILSYLAIMLAERIVVPIPPSLNMSQIDQMRSYVSPALAMVQKRSIKKFRKANTSLPIINESSEVNPGEHAIQGTVQDQKTVLPESVQLNGIASIMFTSGSTGTPRGVIITHENIISNTTDIIEMIGLTRSDRALLTLPTYYCFGASILHTHLRVGGALNIISSFMFPEKVLDEMLENQCTGMAGVPSTFQILLRNTKFAQRQFPDLKWIQQAGGKLATPLLHDIHGAFPGVDLFVMYGQTEATARLSILPSHQLKSKMESIGQGLPQTRLTLHAPDGALITAPEKAGEIYASGPNISPGYWNAPQETQRFFKDGSLKTGDIAKRDSEGDLYIIGRERQFIKSMGNRVSPQEIESCLLEIAEIVEVAVIGLADPLWGEAIHACYTVQSDAALSETVLKKHCLQRLPNYKIPQYWHALNSLPKNASGKLDKISIKQQLINSQDA